MVKAYYASMHLIIQLTILGIFLMVALFFANIAITLFFVIIGGTLAGIQGVLQKAKSPFVKYKIVPREEIDQ